MTDVQTSGMIKFLDNEYPLVALDKAIGKSNLSNIDAGSEFHEHHFDPAQFPADWSSKFKHAVVTQRDGKYVFIFRPEGLDTSKGFKAKFVTKYNMNQAKFVEAPSVDVNQPIYEEPSRPYYKKPYDNNKRSNYDRPNQSGGGYNNNRRYGGTGS